ncbi:MAG: protein translocase subunit SecD [Chloroflexota bacterium]
MRKDFWILIFILLLFGLALWTITPIDSERFGRHGIQLGLDLRGGSHIVYEADLSKKDPSQSDADAMTGVIQKIERRINEYGVAEPIIQQLGTDRILVQLPGVRDINEAIRLLGQTAELDFRELKLGPDGKPVVNDKGEQEWIVAKAKGSDGQEKELTGKYFKPNAQVVISQQKSEPEVAFEWNSEGAILFKQITERNLQKPLGIFLDGKLISSPTVQAVIEDRGVITGLTIDEAKTLAIQLNSGALDVPLTIIQRSDVDATLGADSLQKSLIAGLIGLALVIVFMIIYYRVPGVIAAIALSIYAVLVLSIFKMLPVVLTLPGMAGFIVSIGMAVDANVLIFERMKEELRAGKTLGAAVDAGFNRAWSAIRDSNITTFIACGVLYWLGGTLGAFMVRGFAVTLFLGVLVSMFTAIMVSRTFLRLLVASHWVTSIRAYGVKR